MSRLINIARLTVLISLIKVNLICAQEINIKPEKNNAVERINMITDRNTYLVNETIFFRLYNSTDNLLCRKDWSRVAYVEIVTPDGLKVSQRKYMFDSTGGSGFIKIPTEIQSGNYYIRAYTKWMRNFSPYTYAYNQITILNPNSDKVLLSSDLNSKSQKILKIKHTPVEIADIEVYTDKKVYNMREPVKIQIKTGVDFMEDNYTISVVKKDEFTDPQHISFTGFDNNFSLQYIPETRGLSVTGKVINMFDSLPIANKLVYLTVFASKTDNIGTLTDTKGRFFFQLPDIIDESEIFLNTSIDDENNIPLILVDNDFCNKEIQLPYVPLNITSKNLTFYNELSVNAQLYNAFFSFENRAISERELINPDDSIFYGAPDFMIDLQEYIELPTLSDYFEELIPMVFIKRKAKRSYFLIYDVYEDLRVFEPLVLIDMVAISDVSKILSISPTEVKRIEIIKKPYIRGSITYGGIISIFSKKNDFAGVVLPESGRFFNYKMFDPRMTYYNEKSHKETHIPDSRNCLYWNSSIKLYRQQKQTIMLDCGDTAGEYIIHISGYQKNGDYVKFSKSFWVQNN